MSVIPKNNGSRVYENYTSGIEEEYDVIIIGSGMGGMSCAAALSKLGHKVLVLEQHYIPGGFTHMFGRKGYKWDVGVHVMGEMTKGELPHRMLMWLTNNQVKMNLNGDPFDSFFFPEDFEVHMAAGKQKFLDHLYEKFPDEKDKIDAYWKTTKRANIACRSFFLFQTLPKWLDKTLSSIYHAFIPNYWLKTTAEILDSHNIHGKLRLALTSHWGYYGSVPKDSSFSIHALTHHHFGDGAYFPEGGSSAFASAMLSNVIDAGGRVLCKAEVDEIQVENGIAKGVKMADGTVIRAKKVVSAAGAKTTVNRLIPQNGAIPEWVQKIKNIKDSPSYICLNLAFKADITKLGANGCNRWLYTVSSNDIELWDIANKDERPHLLYVSFPSTKVGKPIENDKHTGEVVTFVHWSAYQKWSETKFGDRPSDYEAFKQEVTDRLLTELKIRMPELMEHLDFCELSTPLTAKHYTRANNGAIYGLAATPDRFACDDLRVRTPIKNFYMSGVDIATLGVVAGMTSGILTAAAIDKRAYLKLL